MVSWKDVLRPIRDGFRDQLPTRPSKDMEEDARRRRLQRELDVLKGFAYFDTFEELQQWDPKEVDPLQRANIPLIPRPDVDVDQERDDPKAKIILIHDYVGNYHDYEACQGPSLSAVNYSCDYMQYVDAFVYFSHKLVCVPPPTWTNTLHHNGVRSIGTFLVEPQSTNIGQILERRPSTDFEGGWEYPVATQLTTMAEAYGFEGWLVNIEKTFPFSIWNRELLVGFLTQLKSQLGHGNVIWYDALTASNMIQYQNGLTDSNAIFAKAAGTILTNYDWDVRNVEQSRKLALENSIDPTDIVFGIDVWAQNSQSDQKPRRTFGGGGTETGVAVAVLAKHGTSAGIFAPAWPFEHFSSISEACAVQDAMWKGTKLPKDLHCNCTSTDAHPEPSSPITQSAREAPAGSDCFLHADFKEAFNRSNGMDMVPSHFGESTTLPRVLLAVSSDQTRVGETTMSLKLLEDPPRASINATQRGSNVDASLELYKLRMRGCLEVSIAYRKKETPADLYIKFELCGTTTTIPVRDEACKDWKETRILDCTREPLAGIRVVVRGMSPKTGVEWEVLEVTRICIKRASTGYASGGIKDYLQLVKCGNRSRLRWSVPKESEEAARAQGLPFSSVTGAFPYFELTRNTKSVGHACALEYLLNEETETMISDTDQASDYTVTCFDFHGSMVGRRAVFSVNQQLRDDSESEGSWEIV